jgi:long-subunit fatty acid transport protein
LRKPRGFVVHFGRPKHGGFLIQANRFARRAAGLILGAALLGVGTVRAQIDQDPDTSLKYNLSTPGARSLAMGGAFLALADDATAAYTNPAGLTNLTVGGSEVAVEVRRWDYETSFSNRGRAAGSPSGFGVDSVDDIRREEAESDVTGLSFLSFAYVLPRGIVFAVYRHELANFETAFETQGPFVDQPGGTPARFLPQRSQTDLEIVNHGVSGAFEVRLPGVGNLESTLSVGVGLSFYEVELDQRNEWFDVEPLTMAPPETQRLPGDFYGPPDFTDDNLLDSERQIADDDDVGFSLGLLWRLGQGRRWSVGAVFRLGPEFDTRFTGIECDEALIPGPHTGAACEEDEPSSGTLHVPDTYGVGVAYRAAGGRSRVSFDVDRVRYSQQLADFTAGLDPNDPEDPDPGDFEIEDADQFHLGFERIFLVVESLFVGTVRLGIWNDPFHELEFTGSDPQLAESLARDKDDEIHYSIGVGLVITEDYQVDFAADFSDGDDTYSFSLVKFF